MDILPGREPQGQSEWRLPAQPDAHRESGHPGGPHDCRCVTALTPQHLKTEKQMPVDISGSHGVATHLQHWKCKWGLGDSFKILPFRTKLGFESLRYLTKKGEVTKKSSQQVHDKHGQDGDVGNTLHAFLGGTEVKVSRKMTTKLLALFPVHY